MELYQEELAQVRYGPNAIKTATYTVNRGQNAIPMHWHDRMEVIYLHSGELKIGYGDNIHFFKSNEMYIIPPKTPHSAVCLSENALWDVLMFDIRSFYNKIPLSCDILPAIFDGRAKFKMVLNNRETADCYQKIIDSANDGTFESIAQTYLLIDLLLKHALIEIGDGVKGGHVVEEALAYIKDNLDKELTTKALSERFNYSEEHFCRLFKEATKVTPTGYIRINRLTKAAHLLRNEKRSISEIAVLCGFNDHNYFSRCFKAHFGKSPSEYLKAEGVAKNGKAFKGNLLK